MTCCPNPLVASANGDVALLLDDRQFTAQELASHVLEGLKRQTETELNTSVDSAVIAVPSIFNALQRRAVLDAARLAGLEVPQLINSTTAAAVGYASLESQAKRIALMDFGAGSFSVSLIDIDGGDINVLSTAGDPLLGGDDVDRRLVLYMLDRIFDERGVDVSSLPVAIRRLNDAATAAKEALTRSSKLKPIVLLDLPTPDGGTIDFHDHRSDAATAGGADGARAGEPQRTVSVGIRGCGVGHR